MNKKGRRKRKKGYQIIYVIYADMIVNAYCMHCMGHRRFIA